VLAAALLALPAGAAGCKGVGGLGTPPKPHPDVAVLQHAISAEQFMVAGYRTVLAAAPTLARSLNPLLAEHEAHLARLKGRLVPGAAAAKPPRQPRPKAPASAAAAVSYLTDAEHAAATSLISRIDVASPSLAQLLASIAASEATHAAALAGHGGI
jgi:hypothetical protein